ncbi:unnamed protein product [Cuscuta campestris]|uniref:Uncharacterized protein n=1 Tax=Cuscuta campestris TaxID=132261 RepID=A0A484MK74_9ASTE|nr:unnamed protein product [Cuscuta campestris]
MADVAKSGRRVSGQQQISDGVGDKTRLSKVIGSPQCEEMHHEVPKRAMNKNTVRPKSSECYQKQRPDNKDEELVKHMSNLPKYLQRTEMEKSVQAKALSFGVIDWNHLEKWKYSDRIPARDHEKVSVLPSSGGDLSCPRPPKAYSSFPQQKHMCPPFPHEQKLSGPMKHSRGKSMPGQEFFTAPVSTKPVTSRRKSSEANINKDSKVSDDKSKPGKDDMFSDQSKIDRRDDQNGRDKVKAGMQVNCAPKPRNIVILMPKAKHSQISESQTFSNVDSMEPEKKSFSQESCSREHSPIPPSTDKQSSMKDSLDSSETSEGKGKYPSPTRRFSMNLGMMNRSLSFKETPTAPRLPDTHTIPKSGPVSSGVERSKANGKGRSSPLRRLLDPLLLRSSKGTHTAETSNEKLDSTSNKEHPTSSSSSSSGALLQLSIKDGLPFFKFVVDGSQDILVAAVKQLPKTGKGDGRLVYSIYTVSEIKKKSGGWMGHGSKGGEKCSEFGYNMIGLMKVSSSYVFKSGLRESVLYSVNLGQVVDDKQTASEFLPDREIAAIIVPNSGSIVVIRPGGVHGLPQKGTPSSLVERWKSGGVCDCGGWDVGCKLQVLTEHEKDCNNLALFLQGGEQERKLIFSLAPLRKGLYTVQFDQLVPLVEAFSICVTILTGQKKVCRMLEVADPSVSSGGVREAEVTTAAAVQGGQGSAKYAPSPPPSPVARI